MIKIFKKFTQSRRVAKKDKLCFATLRLCVIKCNIADLFGTIQISNTIFAKNKTEMSRDTQLKERWENVVTFLSEKFADGDVLDLDAIIYLIGVQELGKINTEFKKDEKVNLMHIAICKLLEPYGYYEFEFFDKDGWPHYKVTKELPTLKAGEQSVLMKEAIVNYFLEKEIIN